MDDDKKKKIMIGIIVGCLVLAVGITIFTQTGGGGGGFDANAKIYMLCANPDCKASYEMTIKEFQEEMQAMGPEGMMMPGMGPMVLTCKECGKKSAYQAEKCEKCGEIFVPNYMNAEDYPDRCPKCQYSKMEEMYKKNK